MLWHSLHLNKSFPDALLYGALQFEGIGLHSLQYHHCYIKLMIFLWHIRFNDETGSLLTTTIARTQMELRVFNQFFKLQHSEHSHLKTHTWVTHLWEFLNWAHVTLECSNASKLHLLHLQRRHDINLMETLLQSGKFNKLEQVWINEYRMCLDVTTLADIATSNGKQITTNYING